jgi:hypothetical protein
MKEVITILLTVPTLEASIRFCAWMITLTTLNEDQMKDAVKMTKLQYFFCGFQHIAALIGLIMAMVYVIAH